MAVIISNTFLYSPPLRTLKFHNQYYNNTNFSHNNTSRYIKLFTFKCNANNNDYDLSSEESRWRREEQRWLREEQRWLREESRWINEKNSLLLQIQHLQSQIDRFRTRNDFDFDVDSKMLVKFAAMLKGLQSDSDSKRITDFIDKEVQYETQVDDLVDGETIDKEKEKETENTKASSGFKVGDEGDEILTVQEPVKVKEEKTEKSKVKATSSLRMGAEGEDVRVLQEVLMGLGFYSGEEDMEYSSFSDGTARAVKTWQASIGIHEDGIMTAELLERLYASQDVQSSESSLKADIPKIEKEKKKEKTKVKATSSLRMGAEGEDVRILQEALMSLGFYSGEEEMEFSSFSDGTASAVKTWQASIGIHEDGIMTPELLERLYASQEDNSSESSLETYTRKIDEANGAVAKVKEVQQTVVKKTDVDISRPRVFLLGENRWEEPSRLNKTKINTQDSARKCLTCKGEGRLLCMECDGTGEPNVEEQFLDWTEEEQKCPYCDGLGYSVCDVCYGKPVI